MAHGVECLSQAWLTTTDLEVSGSLLILVDYIGYWWIPVGTSGN